MESTSCNFPRITNGAGINEIIYGPFNTYSLEEIRKILLFVGCHFEREKGDHRIYWREGLKRPVVIPCDDELPVFIIRNNLRILGIDADERDYLCYDPAKDRLEELILNKEVKLEKGIEDKDQWCRYLRYVILGKQNIYKFVQNPEKYYSQKTIRVRGTIKQYQGKPEIILENPSQIETGK